MLTESKIRRELSKLGYRLNKTPSRSWMRAEYGVGYQVINGNNVVMGASQREYEATLAEVQEWLEQRKAA
ncbi:hypothetical protein [Ensifer sp. SL37]|uniref:hypothetical protein n=1 Tax=Ensifer sp. SL37 TaxID=2995137 RepID=UPI0022741A2D|nr:hypothetical protein [Ensifer sp. SL37]MCY1740391.1 hypothetical protein [Ensifer sp. SL37]